MIQRALVSSTVRWLRYLGWQQNSSDSESFGSWVGVGIGGVCWWVVTEPTVSRGLYEDAVKSLDRAMQFKPDTPEGWVLVTKILCRRGKSYESMREYDSALTDARRCLEINPDCVSGYILAGTATQHMGKLKQAVKWFKQGLVVSPGHKHLKAKLERAQYLARVKRYGFFENVIGTF
eukprot:TRINITY_DN2224_c0_g1_i4.p1 TRINITY_DN2224_c0_g1~~TRINITY_DN2224_c0_g1_i4.p1  ORF type:complete len:177 (-),score=10.66 TRINITY_DN2224_c0_g1_i4:137-667(-)